MYYLYVKTHNITGLKYLGQTTKNPFNYRGSGLYWKSHLAKHGRDMTTEIIKECETMDDLKKWGIYYSDLWNIVDSDVWANLKPEIGDGGCAKGTNKGRKHSLATRRKISKNRKGIKPSGVRVVSPETRTAISLILTGRTVSEKTKRKRRKTLKLKKLMGLLKHTEATKQKMRKPKSASHIANMKVNHTKPTTGYIHINNGIEEKFVKRKCAPKGWVRGRLVKPIPPDQKGKKWITNDEINRMVHELPNGLPNGWRYGRVKNDKKIH
jgi:hypothetical protein